MPAGSYERILERELEELREEVDAAERGRDAWRELALAQYAILSDIAYGEPTGPWIKRKVREWRERARAVMTLVPKGRS